jgi:diacylglycerol kinase (ATP)
MAVIIFASLILENRTDILILSGAIALVLICEIFNTAIELITDMSADRFHPRVKIIKDIVAGGVLISVLNAILVGYLIFVRQPFIKQIGDGIDRVKQSDWHVTFIALVVLLAVVLSIKAVFQKGTPLRGGMPSGHSAVAFALWIAVSFISDSGFISFLTLILALLVARSRVAGGVHTLWEVIAGALAGTFVTMLIFQLLWK